MYFSHLKKGILKKHKKTQQTITLNFEYFQSFIVLSDCHLKGYTNAFAKPHKAECLSMSSYDEVMILWSMEISAPVSDKTQSPVGAWVLTSLFSYCWLARLCPVVYFRYVLSGLMFQCKLQTVLWPQTVPLCTSNLIFDKFFLFFWIL